MDAAHYLICASFRGRKFRPAWQPIEVGKEVNYNKFWCIVIERTQITITMSTPEGYKKDFLFLTTLRDDDVIDDIEKDMIETMKEIRQQIKVSHALDAEWTLNDWRREEPETSQDDSSLPGGSEHMLIVNRFLRTASVTKEKLLRFTQRYLLFDTIYAILVKYDEVSSATRTNFAEAMKFREERVKIKKELKKLDKNIDKMSQELGLAEKRVMDEKGEIAQFHQEERLLVQEFNSKIKGMEDRLESFMFSSADQLREPISQVEALPDEEYMAKLVDEVRDVEEDIGINKECNNLESINSDDDSKRSIVLPAKRDSEDVFDEYDDPDYVKKRRYYEPDVASHIKELEQDLDDLYYGLKFLPQRKIGETSAGVESHVRCSFCGQYGVHYSDSCPELVNGDERFSFIVRERLCQYCLEDCNPRRRCKSRNKRCWCCGIVERTVLNFLIPNDDGHHRALCSIPDSKNKIAERIAEIKEELRLAEQDL
ncbi:hypothetical protein Y032_0102g3465 [Ancylostoma ceylanicum]|uniref:CCHC-type domain-containing protein n=1 Tax=Ancylostoma ceylanicum TaxID=53326 RepID=A0A016THD0_9BILA|nr:hypothetical protein Y032_0102g3465 [Ancylostoma ceylanicum]